MFPNLGALPTNELNPSWVNGYAHFCGHAPPKKNQKGQALGLPLQFSFNYRPGLLANNLHYFLLIDNWVLTKPNVSLIDRDGMAQ
jgi:hypothetical protein